MNSFLNSSGSSNNYYTLSIISLCKRFSIMTVGLHSQVSVTGFLILIILASQIISGVMLSFSFLPEPMIAPISRDEEDIENQFTDIFFWIHERGVDTLFIFSYIHLFRKLFMANIDIEVESSWKSGLFVFLIFQVVVFFGLVLCCTHLSEITLTIAANILHTFFLFKGKAYWWLFTDKQLNTDTLIRLAYAHYLSAFYMMYLGVLHGIEMHYDWKTDSSFDGYDSELSWWDEALTSEISYSILFLFCVFLSSLFLFEEPEALSYEIFMWGDVGMVTDVRYYGVAPHWYFRPFMAWLIACPHHITGILGLLFFMISLYFQPTIHGVNYSSLYKKKLLNTLSRKKFNVINIPNEFNMYYSAMFGLFLISCLYAASFLPYGRFFNRIGGNMGLLYSYFFIFIFLGIPRVRKPLLLNLLISNIVYKRA